MMDQAPSSDNKLLAEWRDYFADLLNNDSGPTTSPLPPLADQDKLPICVDPPTLEEVHTPICSKKRNKAAGLNCAVTAEALRGWRTDGKHGTCLCRNLHLTYSS